GFPERAPDRMADHARGRSQSADAAADADGSVGQPISRRPGVRLGAAGHTRDRQSATARNEGVTGEVSMTRMVRWIVASVGGTTPNAWAGPSADDVTITVVDEGATPNDVVKVIELPDRVNLAPKNSRGDTGKGATKDPGKDTGRDKDVGNDKDRS